MDPQQVAPIGDLDEIGYVNLGQVLDERELNGFRQALEKLPKRDRDTDTLFFTQKRLEIPALAAFSANGRHVEMLRKIYRRNLRCYFDQFVVKPANTPSGVFPWHQDAGYSNDATAITYPDDRRRYRVTVWFAMDDITPENGGIWIIPGSHRNGRMAHENKTSWYNELQVPEGAGVPVRLMAGEAVAFTEYTVHRSLGNPTNRPRRSLFLAYCDADACYPGGRPLNEGVAGNPYFPAGSAPLVSGASKFQ